MNTNGSLNNPESRPNPGHHIGTIDAREHQAELLALFDALRKEEKLSAAKLNHLMIIHVHEKGQPVPQSSIIAAYKDLVEQQVIPFEHDLFERLRLKPTRTISGVAPVAVLTGPYPCPADCIFCPDAKGIPRSYLPDEPAVQRAQRARFDPFKETAARIDALDNMGHSTDKIELLVIGATWSAYPQKYQEWFIRRCLDAMNGEVSSSLLEAQKKNESADHRCVGLVVETRPDYVTLEEARRLRWLGITKVQIGLQSTDDRILLLNRRGHTIEDTRRALRVLRLAGFKLQVHWMPNLLGATPESDVGDFAHLWSDLSLRPDELKIYPCALIEGTDLYELFRKGEYRPYTDEELVDTLVRSKAQVPPYCRINRVIRDIPAHHIIAGSRQSHLRVIVQREMHRRGLQCQCLRCRQVHNEKLRRDELTLDDYVYETDVTVEHFLSFVTVKDRVAGFLRLSLPKSTAPRDLIIDEIRQHAMIRELHVYGPALDVGADSHGEAQHLGLGRQLIEKAIEVARAGGFNRISVISAIGTREYYRKQGFQFGELYMSAEI